MSYNLQDYFQLGLDSEAQPQNSLVMNTIRSPVNTQSGRDGLSKVTFKMPKIGMLTGDSMVTVQFIENPSPDATRTISEGDVTPNFISGALGCIERARLLVDNKVLTDLERPSMLEIPKIYSERTENEVAEFSNKFLATQFQTDVSPGSGEERFNFKKTRYLSDAAETAGVQNVIRNRVTSQPNSKVYGLHLKHLGAQFLENDSLPVFLLGERELVLELFFYKDCRQYIVTPTGAAGQLKPDTVLVNYPLVELVTTHIQLPDEVQANEIANLSSNPVSYPLHDNYVVKSNYTSKARTELTQKTFRINAQNRELHKLLMVHNPVVVQDTNRLVGMQQAVAVGDITLQMKSNGLNVFERPVTNPSILYQQTTYAHNGMALKLPYGSFHVNRRVDSIPQSPQDLYNQYRGTQHYLAIDFKNGNGGVFGGGTVQKQAIEIDYSSIARTAAAPNQDTQQFDVLFYLTVSKMLTIGSKSIDISF
tara:strand:- start:1411 stop:2844 length:1434 start_codon:yes stop_codon:yes gene_type:complete